MIIAGLDFGTSGVKLSLIDSQGHILARAQSNYETHTAAGGVVEQNAQQWWRAAAIALAKTGMSQKVDAIGLTGQMQDLILVSDDSAVRPVLLYSDTRASHEHELLRSQLPQWEERTGNHQDSSNVVAKIAWLTTHEPENLRAAHKILLSAPGFIAWKATGVAACDVLTASTTGLLDVQEKAWFEQAVIASGAQMGQMPQLVGQREGDDVVGFVSETAAQELNLRPGIPVVLATGDAGATTDGLVGSNPGDAYLYLGTTGWLAAVTPANATEVSPIHSLVMPGWHNRLRIGAVQSAGVATEWARKTFFSGKSFEWAEQEVASRVLEPEALSVRPLTLPGLSGERTPVRDPLFQGAFVGVKDATTAADFYLGVLTGVAMGLRHAADEMGWSQDRLALVGGAAWSPSWRAILADVFHATIVTRETDDPGTYSAARVALRALDPRITLPPLFDVTGEEMDETTPSELSSQYQELLSVHRGLYSALAPTFHSL